MKKSYLYTGLTIIVLLAVVGAGIYMNAQTSPFWRAYRKNIMPQLMPVEHKEKMSVVFRPFSKKVDIGYVLDDGDQYHFVMKEQFAAWGISQEELHKKALKNLEKLTQDSDIAITKMEGATYAITEVLDGYAAARILLPSFRQRLVEELGEPFVAAIPTRDFLIAWPKDFPLHDQFGNQVIKEFKAEEDYPLSPNPFIVTKETVTPVAQ